MLEINTKAPDFQLPDTNGKIYSLRDFKNAPTLLVMFICNHCPFVKHIRGELASMGKEYQKKGAAIVAINSNDFEQYPEDSPAKMKEEIANAGYTFPYLVDQTQAVAKAYKAACTPDFFLFNHNQELIYRGRLDDSSPGNNQPVTGKDLRSALDQALQRKAPESKQLPSWGCNIKWRSS